MRIYLNREKIALKTDIYVFEQIFEEEICEELLEELKEDPPDDIRSYRLLIEEDELDDMIARAKKYIDSGKDEDGVEIAYTVLMFASYFKELYDKYRDGSYTDILKSKASAASDEAAVTEETKE